MDSTTWFLRAADAVLVLHVLFVAFVVLGLLLIFLGKCCAWAWVRNPCFRLLHLVAIAVVVLQSWLGLICPLTTFEMLLRDRAGAATYSGSFIAHWLERVLYYDAAPWVFIACYTMFGIAVAISWYWIRPRRFNNARTSATRSRVNGD